MKISPIKLIDFDTPNNNVFHCTGEFTCRRDGEEFRPDITLFVNGLPLVFMEVKKPNNKGGMIAESNRMNNIRFPNKKFRRFINITQLMIFSNNKEYDTLGIEVYVLNDMSEEEISSLLFPERAKAGDGYLIPDFKWEEFQMCKHRSSIRLCWRRYCKRAAKQNLMAYSWKSFIILYNAYRKPKIEACDPNDKIRDKLKDFNFL